MTTDEKLVVIARAILEIEQKAVRTWDNDGEDAYGAGLFLDESRKLEEIADHDRLASRRVLYRRGRVLSVVALGRSEALKPSSLAQCRHRQVCRGLGASP